MPEKRVSIFFRALVAGSLFALAVRAEAQIQTPENPAYVDDSTAARDMLVRLDELVAQGSSREAIRNLQQVLDDNAYRVLPDPRDPDLHIPVRDVLRRRLAGDAALLADYREMMEPGAADLLATGNLEELVRTRVLTRSGLEGVLRLAQLQIESARFEAAMRTLGEAEGHPDLSTRRGDVTALVRLLARYLDSDRATALLARWEVQGGGDAIAAPAGTNVPVIGPSEPGPATDVAAIVPRPLATVRLSPVPPTVQSEEDETALLQRQMNADQEGIWWSLPVASADAVYTNDGDTISAWDRFTLRRLWQVQRNEPTSDSPFEQIDIRRRQSRRIEDTCEPTVAGDRLIAVSGLAVAGTRQGDGRVHCIDRASGRVLWSVEIDTLDPQLSDTSVRGPCQVVEGTVVVTARKSARERRIISLYFVGLDLETGELRWVRLLGSAGALPFQTSARFPERSAAMHGVVYRSDEIGIIAAVRAENGAPLWVRKSPSFRIYDNDVRPAWTSSGPIVRDDTLLTLSPNREQILSLDPENGLLRAQLSADRLAAPGYLLASPTHLVGVGDSQVAWIPIDGFPSGRIGVSSSMRSPSIVGRAGIAGERVVVPRSGSITTVPMDGGEEQTTAVDQTGNALALNGQLLVADQTRLHSYMVWDVASNLLAQRVADDPDNPAPAATLAELAYRAGKFDQIIGAVDQALQAIARDPRGNEATRASLFAAVLRMVDPERRADHNDEPKIATLGTLEALARRLAALAERPEELVAYHLVEAALRESGGHADEAVESLQHVLSDPMLASAFWRGGDLTIRADLEATRRLRDLLTRRGWSTYAAFEREARAQLDVLGERAGPEALERLAEQYPFATLTPRLWLMAADRSGDDARLRMLSRGTRSAEAVRGVGGAVDRSVIAELYGQLISGLAAARRGDEARSAAQELDRLVAGVTPTIQGQPIEVDTLLSTAAETLGDATRRPAIGSVVLHQEQPRLEQGRVLVATMENTSPRPHDEVLMVSPSTQTLRLLTLDESGVLTQRWTKNAPFEPILLEHGPRGIFIAWLDPTGTVIERVDPGDGHTLWEQRPFESPGARDGVNRAALLSGFVTPLEGRVFTDQLLLAGDERSIVVAERSGRIVTLDRGSGTVAWSGQSSVERVFDLAMASGMLVVAGAAPDEGERWRAAVVTINARTGQVTSRMDEPPGTVRWVRVTDTGLAIAGLDRGVVCLDLDQSAVRWMLSEEPATASLDAWVFDDDLYLLDQARKLWRVSIASGRLHRPELETRMRLVDRVGILADRFDGHTLFASGSGLLVFNRESLLVGIDAFEAAGALVASAPGQHFIALLDTAPFETPDRLSSYQLHLMTTESARLTATYALQLPTTPESVTLLDGLILISAGDATMVLEAPAP